MPVRGRKKVYRRISAGKANVNGKIKKHPLNVPGKYYVDYDVCLNHECCIDEAPNNFKIDEDYIAYVFKQPETEDEEIQCKNAMNCCPVEAILNDGQK